ncbi:MAG: tetratricopeptide repeat protein [Burkholderiales bacterium]
MTQAAFDDWLARGRVHRGEGRPADAIPCFRRAAREDPRSPVPHFHLGEVLWQLGLAEDAIRAWTASAALDTTFAPPRLALAEVALTRGDFATAALNASQAFELQPGNTRARVTALAARAALGEAPMTDAVAVLSEHPEIAASLPLILLAALAERGAAIPAGIAQRAFTMQDAEALRRLALVARATEAGLCDRLAQTYCTLMASQRAATVPLLWPVRTTGTRLRLAWVMPDPEASDFASAHRALDGVLQVLGARVSVLLLCSGDAERTRAAIGERAAAGMLTMALPPEDEPGVAKAIAVRDCDVLVDAAGLAARIASMLVLRPARRIVALDTGAPTHRPPVVDATYAQSSKLTLDLAQLQSTFDDRPGENVDTLAERWDAAVRLHAEGDLEGAAAAYARVLDAQPGHAPALHLAGVVAAARERKGEAAQAFAAAIAAEPRFVDARVSAIELALAEHEIERAHALVEEGLALDPRNLSLMRMRGRVMLRRRDGAGAERAFRELLMLAPADADAHFRHGVALQRVGDPAAAARAYQRALTLRPDLIHADFNLGVIFEQQGNGRAAEAAYSHVLSVDPTHVAAYKRLGELLLASGEIDRWLANFKAFEKHCPKSLALAVQALEACQHQGDFERLAQYIDGLRRDDYRAEDEEDLADCLESLLYLLLFFDVEPSTMLRLSQAYDALAPKVYGPRLPAPGPRKPGRLRVGYLSGDLRNHVMGKMMWQAVQHHDRERFELFFYSTTTERDEWTAKFEGIASRFDFIALLDDASAASRIAGDDLDLLVDLSTHTKGSRPAILAAKPARVAMTHVASAGTVGLSQIDWKLTDRYCDVPESQEFMIERLLAMDGCVYPYRHVVPAATHPFHRPQLGIAAGAIVIGAFVNPLKLSRRCMRLWREVLERIPEALIAFSPANPAMRASYVRIAKAAGIAEDRLLFLPQGRTDEESQARYHLIDFVLDTMPFGGVNGTIEALDMNVPVVTLAGKRHGERTSYSILENLGVRETIAQSGRDYVAIAERLARDASFRANVKRAIASGMASSPLVDMPRHTRNLEAAYVSAIERWTGG